ncbi:HlyD family secretion protein [Lichenicoccus roseus]|uniref:HlyD family secretion protein n=1 Tax=Lichenicoccus roseus TaxID=2683649 RepID=A0A5R9J6F2_9PROT|nr:HlyD family secretion protein [Lichenicoccus roseus]TLU73194.1 HlyD family secretion protein [Lichenicoccus roseus]
MAENDSSGDDKDQDKSAEQGKSSGQGKPDDSAKNPDDKKASEQEQKREQSRQKAKPWVRLGLILFIIIVVVGGFFYWWTTRFEESTDDAFTAGRTITIAPHVAGYVVELDVNDNEFVHQGQVLARIDPRNYQATHDQAAATLEQAKGQLEGARYQVEVAKQNFPGQLKQAQGQLLIAEANEFNAETEYKRQHNIARAATTQQAVDNSTAGLKQAQGQVLQAQGTVQQNTPIQSNIGNATTRITQQAGSLAQAQAQLDLANLNLEWTVIRAPHDGWISQRNVERGNYVQAAQSLFSIVEPEVWITANFKETQINDIRPGQPVKISVDAYPSLKLEGHVDSIQNGSGAAFSAFPPENATGNYVKIVQRVPVKIIIDDGLNPNIPLPLGISVEPTVDTKSASGR